jgi:hypothetical protein
MVGHRGNTPFGLFFEQLTISESRWLFLFKIANLIIH